MFCKLYYFEKSKTIFVIPALKTTVLYTDWRRTATVLTLLLYTLLVTMHRILQSTKEMKYLCIDVKQFYVVQVNTVKVWLHLVTILSQRDTASVSCRRLTEWK